MCLLWLELSATVPLIAHIQVRMPPISNLSCLWQPSNGYGCDSENQVGKESSDQKLEVEAMRTFIMVSWVSNKCSGCRKRRKTWVPSALLRFSRNNGRHWAARPDPSWLVAPHFSTSCESCFLLHGLHHHDRALTQPEACASRSWLWQTVLGAFWMLLFRAWKNGCCL